MPGEGTILCQPDGKMGCAACCGLFNTRDASKLNLEKYLNSYRVRKSSVPEGTGLPEMPGNGIMKRDPKAYICPYIGFTGENCPGCMIHPIVMGYDHRDLSLFGSLICDSYLCPAHEILTEDQKRALIDAVDDWYLYSIAIIDPESFIWMLECILERVPESAKTDKDRMAVFRELLPVLLSKHGEYLFSLKGPVFHYSLSEYNHAKREFSLMEKSQLADYEKRILIGFINKINL